MGTRYYTRNGFTLIELSVVLVIIGLIVAGVVVGQSMVRSSQVQSIIIDESKYVEAAKQFREKYSYLPGDFPNATSYWGTDPNGCPNSYSHTTPLAQTCNGDGNGFIDSPGSGAGNSTQFFENTHAWQQLANAGFIEGAYSGGPGSGCWSQSVLGLNVPLSKLPNAGFQWYYTTSTGYDQSPYTQFSGSKEYTQYLLIGAPTTGQPCYELYNSVLTPSEALSVDKKVDDGMPTTGKWISTNGGYNCEANTSPLTYNAAGVNQASWYTPYFSSTTTSCALAAEVDW